MPGPLLALVLKAVAGAALKKQKEKGSGLSKAVGLLSAADAVTGGAGPDPGAAAAAPVFGPKEQKETIFGGAVPVPKFLQPYNQPVSIGMPDNPFNAEAIAGRRAQTVQGPRSAIGAVNRGAQSAAGYVGDPAGWAPGFTGGPPPEAAAASLAMPPGSAGIPPPGAASGTYAPTSAANPFTAGLEGARNLLMSGPQYGTPTPLFERVARAGPGPQGPAGVAYGGGAPTGPRTSVLDQLTSPAGPRTAGAAPGPGPSVLDQAAGGPGPIAGNFLSGHLANARAMFGNRGPGQVPAAATAPTAGELATASAPPATQVLGAGGAPMIPAAPRPAGPARAQAAASSAVDPNLFLAGLSTSPGRAPAEPDRGFFGQLKDTLTGNTARGVYRALAARDIGAGIRQTEALNARDEFMTTADPEQVEMMKAMQAGFPASLITTPGTMTDWDKEQARISRQATGIEARREDARWRANLNKDARAIVSRRNRLTKMQTEGVELSAGQKAFLRTPIDELTRLMQMANRPFGSGTHQMEGPLTNAELGMAVE